MKKIKLRESNIRNVRTIIRSLSFQAERNIVLKTRLKLMSVYTLNRAILNSESVSHEDT